MKLLEKLEGQALKRSCCIALKSCHGSCDPRFSAADNVSILHP